MYQRWDPLWEVLQVPHEQHRNVTTSKLFVARNILLSHNLVPRTVVFIHDSRGGSPTVYTTRKIHAPPMLRETYACLSRREPCRGSFPYYGIYEKNPCSPPSPWNICSPSLREPCRGSFPYYGIYIYIYIRTYRLSSLMQGTFLYIQVKSNIVDHKFHKSNC